MGGIPFSLMLPSKIIFLVNGVPRPKGSTQTFFHRGRPITITASKYGKAWEKTISRTAKPHFLRPLIPDVPIGIYCKFTFVKGPKSRFLKHMVDTPDIDKLLRTVLDGLTSIAYVDDRQVVKLSGDKAWGKNPGVYIEVWEEE